VSIKDHAYLAPEMAGWLTVNRKRNREWFELAFEINRLAQQLWNELPSVLNESAWKFTTRLLYLRGINSFQAAVILSNHGLTIDAGTQTRSAFEDLFCLAASKQDEALVARLVRAQNNSRKKIARAVSQLPADLGLEAATAAKLKEFADTYEDGQQLNFAEIADVGSLKPVYDVYYRSLSHDAAHPTLDSLERLLRTNANGDIEGFATGPDQPDIGRTLAYACVAGFYLISTMVQFFENTPVHEGVTAIFDAYKKLAYKTFPDQTP
jgi:Family of unknown function (DUF5677)